MSNKAAKVYEVQQLVPFKGWQMATKPRASLSVALDEFAAYVRVEGDRFSWRVINTASGRVLRNHKKPTATKAKQTADV